MIHIRELGRLHGLKNLRLIAGKNGTEKTVTAAVLFEYDPSRVQLPDFYRGDLVVTTLAYAREDPDLLSKSLQLLLNQGIAGLLVKTAYFQMLPEEVIRQADEQETPIYLFDETYIEEVILQVMDLIRGKRRFTGYEAEIEQLLRGELPNQQLRDVASRICPVLSGSWRVMAFLPKERTQDLDEPISKGLSSLERVGLCMEWKQMRLIVFASPETEESAAEAKRMRHNLGLDAVPLRMGISRPEQDLLQMGTALCEAIYCASAAVIEETDAMAAEEMGLYAYLFPLLGNRFAVDTCRRNVQILRDYDEQNRSNLENTVRAYVHAHMQIPQAAAVLYQHPNTIRYRLAKVRQLLNIREDALFELTLAQTVLLWEIIEQTEGQK